MTLKEIEIFYSGKNKELVCSILDISKMFLDFKGFTIEAKNQNTIDIYFRSKYKNVIFAIQYYEKYPCVQIKSYKNALRHFCIETSIENLFDDLLTKKIVSISPSKTLNCKTKGELRFHILINEAKNTLEITKKLEKEIKNIV